MLKEIQSWTYFFQIYFIFIIRVSSMQEIIFLLNNDNNSALKLEVQ